MQTTYPLCPALRAEFKQSIAKAQQAGKWLYIKRGLEPPHRHRFLKTKTDLIVCEFTSCDFEGRFLTEEETSDKSQEIAVVSRKGLFSGIREAVSKSV